MAFSKVAEGLIMDDKGKNRLKSAGLFLFVLVIFGDKVWQISSGYILVGRHNPVALPVRENWPIVLIELALGLACLIMAGIGIVTGKPLKPKQQVSGQPLSRPMLALLVLVLGAMIVGTGYYVYTVLRPAPDSDSASLVGSPPNGTRGGAFLVTMALQLVQYSLRT